MMLMSLSELEQWLDIVKKSAEKYRQQREGLEHQEERWAKFVELAKAFGVELKLAEGVEFYAGGPLADNAEFLENINRQLDLVRRIKRAYGDIKVIVNIDLNIKSIFIKI